MFSSYSPSTTKSCLNVPTKTAFSEVDSQNSEIYSPLFKSKYSVTSTIDSPTISPRKFPSDIMDQESDQTCFDFETKGYCLNGQQCAYSHELRKEKWENIIWVEKYPEMFFGARIDRRKTFLP